VCREKGPARLPPSGRSCRVVTLSRLASRIGKLASAPSAKMCANCNFESLKHPASSARLPAAHLRFSASRIEMITGPEPSRLARRQRCSVFRQSVGGDEHAANQMHQFALGQRPAGDPDYRSDRRSSRHSTKRRPLALLPPALR